MNLISPPSALAPYSVPCGPRSTSMRSMSNGSRSGASTAPFARPVLEPNGVSSTYVPIVAETPSVLRPRSVTRELPGWFGDDVHAR